MSDLDVDAAALLVQLERNLPEPFHRLGVERSREVLMFDVAPVGPALRRVEELAIAGPGGDLPVRVYRAGTDAGLPAVLYLHGGGWAIGSIDGSDAVCRVLADELGGVVVSVDYRQAPEHPFPAAFDDAWAALTWLLGEAAALGIDSSRIAVAGDSAGGNLAAALAIRARDAGGPQLAAQVLVYPATSLRLDWPSCTTYADAPVLTKGDAEWFASLYLPEPGDRADLRACPAAASSLAGLPPTAVLTASHDLMRDDGEAYAERLRQDGVEVLSRRYDGVFHGFFWMVGVMSAADRAARDAARFLLEKMPPAVAGPAS